MKKLLIALAAVAAVLAAGTFAYAATTGTSVSCTRNVSSGSYTITCPEPVRTKTVTVTVTPTDSTTPPPVTSPPPVTDPPPPPSSTPPGNYSCSVPLGKNCPGSGAYKYAQIPMSNGYNTYLSNQNVGAVSGTSETLNANSPSDWDVVANVADCGGCVQTFPDVQQLTNDWNGSGWGGGGNDTPLASLSTLQINYAETSPRDAGSAYEFAPDIWQDNYNSDVMFWVDTQGRCNEGAFGSTVLGHAVLGGQNWTVHRYGGQGAEVIFVLDGPGGSGTCAQQNSGTVDVKAGLEWLVANGFETGPVVLSQVNTGWEITQSPGSTFTVSQYSITAN